MHDLHHGRNAADIGHASAGHVAGPMFDPFGAAVHFAFGGFRPDNRQIKLIRQPDIRGHAVFWHGFFHPVKSQPVQLPAQIQRLMAAVVMIGVDHEHHVRPDGFAHSGAGGYVAFRVSRVGRLPGMQLEGFIAALLAPDGKFGIGSGGVQPAFQIIAAHGAGIGGNPGAGRPQQAINRLIKRLAQQVPQGTVYRAQHLI